MKHLKHLLAAALAIVLIFSCGVGAFATEPTAPEVRVNGHLIDFPDATPFIDRNNRTLIPVRFVAEELGADVSWNAKTYTAIIKRNGIEVDISIGDSVLTVKNGGKTSKVTMDTEAVLAHDRTYVPIRFVAEQLGAYVDYSDYFNTVGIYNDVLSKEEIERLLSYPLDAVDDYYKNSSAQVSTIANCRELEWRKYVLAEPEKTLNNAVASLNYHSDNLDIKFRTDASCFYCNEETIFGTARNASVRAVVEMTRTGKYTKADGEAWNRINHLLIEGIGGSGASGVETPMGETVTFDAECKFCRNGRDDTYEVLLEMWVLDDPGNHVVVRKLDI